MRLSTARPERLTGAARTAQRRVETVDIFLGVIGFFTLMLFVSTAVAELRGEPAGARAVALAVLVFLVAATLRIRRALSERLQSLLSARRAARSP